MVCLCLIQGTVYIRLVLEMTALVNMSVRSVLQIQNFLQSSAQWKSQFPDQPPPLHFEATLSSIEPELGEKEAPVVENTAVVPDAKAWVEATSDTKATRTRTSLTDGAFFTPEIFSLREPSVFSRCPFVHPTFVQTMRFAHLSVENPTETHEEFPKHLQVLPRLVHNN